MASIATSRTTTPTVAPAWRVGTGSRTAARRSWQSFAVAACPSSCATWTRSSHRLSPTRRGASRAFVGCSLITQGTLRAMIVVHQMSPRAWTPGRSRLFKRWSIDAGRRSRRAQPAEAKLRRQNEMLLRITGHAARLGGWSIELPNRRVTWSQEVCAILELPAGTVPSLEHAIEALSPDSRNHPHAHRILCPRWHTVRSRAASHHGAKPTHMGTRHRSCRQRRLRRDYEPARRISRHR